MPIVLRAMALGARTVEADQDGIAHQQPRGYAYHSSASWIILPENSIASISDLQSYCLDVLWLLGATNPWIAWTSVGLSRASLKTVVGAASSFDSTKITNFSAVRKAVNAGAHSETHTGWRTNVLDDQLRRRAFHMLLLLDRELVSTRQKEK